MQQVFQAGDHCKIIVADLEQHFRGSRNDARCTRIEHDTSGRPYRARAATRREAIVDRDAEPRQRQAGVPANGHPGRAGVILLAGKHDPVLPDADDGRDDADLECAAFERLALLDMGLDISAMASAFDVDACPAGESSLAQRIAHGLAAAAVARRIDIRLRDTADIGPAAEEAAEMSFLVAPGCDFDSAAGIGIGIDDPGRFERVDDAERPIEPAGIVLAFEMRSRQQFRSRLGTGAEHVANAVDLGRQPGFGQPLRQPVQRADVRFGEGRLVDAGLVGADGTECVQVGEDPGAVGVLAMVRHQARPCGSDQVPSGLR